MERGGAQMHRLLGPAPLRRVRCLTSQSRQVITLQKPWVQLGV